MIVNIMHYLNTFKKKPGAINNSIALKSIPKLKAIFDTYYSEKPKDFIDILLENKHLGIEDMIKLFRDKTSNKAEFKALTVVRSRDAVGSVDMQARSSMAAYTTLVRGGRQA